MKSEKLLEYYLDSKSYTYEEIKKNIENIKNEFPNKNVETTITLNNFGVYIVTFKFENKNTYFTKLKNKLLPNDENLKTSKTTPKKVKVNNKKDKWKSRLEKYSGCTYGKYKQTGIYHPY